jgi:hypothetical protein
VNDVKQLLRRVRKQGFAVRVGGTGHYRVSRGGQSVTVSATPRSSALAKVRADLRRIGARL